MYLLKWLEVSLRKRAYVQLTSITSELTLLMLTPVLFAKCLPLLHLLATLFESLVPLKNTYTQHGIIFRTLA